MMGRQTKLGQVVRGMQAVTDLPITAKIRTGIFEDKFIAHKLVPKLRDWGISMTTVLCFRINFLVRGCSCSVHVVFPIYQQQRPSDPSCPHSRRCAEFFSLARFMAVRESSDTRNWLTGITSTKW